MRWKVHSVSIFKCSNLGLRVGGRKHFQNHACSSATLNLRDLTNVVESAESYTCTCLGKSRSISKQVFIFNYFIRYESNFVHCALYQDTVHKYFILYITCCTVLYCKHVDFISYCILPACGKPLLEKS